MGVAPFVSIVVPCRNEERFIRTCLESLTSQTYPAMRIEIIVVDGNSTDNTHRIAETCSRSDKRIRLLENPQEYVAFGLNRGIDTAAGEIIIRVDGHTTVDHDFVEQSVRLLRNHPEAWCVGGPIVHEGRSLTGQAIAIAMSHPFGVGNAKHHFSDYEGYVDGTAMATCWRWLFDRVGTFDENFIRNEDDELSFRIAKHGGRTYVSPAVRYTYRVRDGFYALWHQYLQYGFWKLALVRKHRQVISLRMFVPTLFVTAILVGILNLSFGGFVNFTLSAATPVVYFATNLCASLRASRKQPFPVKVRVPLAFVVMHVGYGLGLGCAFLRWMVGLADRIPPRMTALTR
jgi:succinoglycan biosynthesis protein ExoA